MSEAITPLQGNARGEGWHLRSRRMLLLRILAPAVGALLAGSAVVGFLDGDTGVGALAAVAAFGAVFAAIPFVITPGPAGPARRVRRDGVDGLLLPAPALGPGAVLVFGVLGTLFLMAAVAAVVMAAGGGVIVRSSIGRPMATPVGAVVCGVFAVLFLAATVAIVRSRRRDRGLVLTAERIHLPGGVTIPWAAVTEISPRWARAGAGPAGGGPVTNWIVFHVPAGTVPADSRLVRQAARITGLELPIVDVALVPAPPAAVLAILRHYVDHPGDRTELAMVGRVGTAPAIARYEREVLRSGA
ncbi:hypothetical protein [Pseudactinotalea sp. HY158]|uniref:hypothetical protein n=1 Tax=Pseudactinotalea sp. HY158 TaxID=2654547 RepID=UPI00129CF073|nr:hypothetical protein [Pseudactinotalea sp. HY158]QGH69105.1 hypothetical protein GCE65_05985 [Pseudactinotalea sp. HY158]